jgi:GntR family transcriptional regulator/MocR family aminotransferase
LSEHFAHKQYHDGRFGFVLGFSGPSEEKMKKIIIALEKWFTEILDNV